MNIEEFRDYCLAMKGVTESFPFDHDTLVFKVGGKMFALTSLDQFNSINLKCDPERSVELREQYEGVNPGFHMNKRHWNTVSLDKDVPQTLVLDLIEHSYQLVYKSLPKRIKDGL